MSFQVAKKFRTIAAGAAAIAIFSPGFALGQTASNPASASSAPVRHAILSGRPILTINSDFVDVGQELGGTVEGGNASRAFLGRLEKAMNNLGGKSQLVYAPDPDIAAEKADVDDFTVAAVVPPASKPNSDIYVIMTKNNEVKGHFRIDAKTGHLVPLTEAPFGLSSINKPAGYIGNTYLGAFVYAYDKPDQLDSYVARHRAAEAGKPQASSPATQPPR